MTWECFTFSSPCLYITQCTIVLDNESIRYIYDRPYAALPRGADRGSEAASGRHRLADKSNALLGTYYREVCKLRTVGWQPLRAMGGGANLAVSKLAVLYMSWYYIYS